MKAIIRLMKLAGLKPDERGVCHGCAVVALQAFILGKEHYRSYIKRVKEISQLSLMTDEVLKTKFKTCDERGILKYSDILAHLHTIKLFHSPNQFSELSDNGIMTVQSDVAAVASIAQSQLAEKRGGIGLVSSFSGVYSDDDLKIYLTALQKVMELPTHKTSSFGILLSSNRHVIMLVYDAMDAMFPWVIDNAGEQTLFSSDKCDDVAKKISEIFVYSASKDKRLILCSAVYALGEELEKIKPLINHWRISCKTIHRVTAEKANLIDSEKVTWLLCAAEAGHNQMVKLLVAVGADLKIQTSDGRTPLYVAVENGHIEIVNFLLQKGADLAVTTEFGYSPLHVAARHGYTSIVKLLIENRVNSNSTTHNGLTPLHLAVDYYHISIVKLLLKAGANYRSKANDGQTPLSLAEENQYNEIISLFSTANACKPESNMSSISLHMERFESSHPVLEKPVANKVVAREKNNNKTKKSNLLQNFFKVFIFFFVVALILALCIYFLHSTLLIIGIVSTAAILTGITLRWPPNWIAKGYEFIFSTEQENKPEDLSKVSVNSLKQNRSISAPLLHSPFSFELKDMSQSQMHPTQDPKQYSSNPEPQKTPNLDISLVVVDRYLCVRL